jgi:hypothetical protein
MLVSRLSIPKIKPNILAMEQNGSHIINFDIFP